jgi:ATP-binding cassette subfamily G (WHITE) protein 2 (SNQ2)
MNRASAIIVAQSLNDLPIFLIQLAVFTLIIYFMTGLKQTAGHFFTFLLFIFSVTVSTTAFFRFIGQSFGTFNNASKVSGFMFSVLVTVSPILLAQC